MQEFIIKIRNATSGFLYRSIVKPVFFLQDPEDVHDRMTAAGKLLGRFALTRWKTNVLFGYGHPMLEQTVAGIHFKNPIGLAAGFDKDAQLTQILPSVGFGFEEVGSVTGEPCAGNPRPRLWRLKKSQSLAVYYGLKNEGCEAIVKRLRSLYPEWGTKTSPHPSSGRRGVPAFPVGISVAKTNSPDTVEEAAGIRDYAKAYRTFVEAGIGDYFTINISCPNTFGGEPFTEPGKLDRLLMAIREIDSQKPVFIKMPAELPMGTVDELVDVARKYAITGFICTNLAKNRSNKNIHDSVVPEHGGMSGKVVQDLSDRLIEHIYNTTGGEFIIIGCGGVFTAEDAYRKIKLGASLIQLITGMVYRGPQAISEINQGLVQLLKRDGYRNISEAIGKDNE